MLRKPDRDLRKLGLVWVILGDVVGSTLIGMGAGYFAWYRLHFPVWVLILSPMITLTLGFYHLYKITQKEL
jgi:hypothetical protein